MAELEALKNEKDETEEAKNRAEEQIKAMRKEHEEKVISISSFCLLTDLYMYVCKSPQECTNKRLLKAALKLCCYSLPFYLRKWFG